MGLKNLQNVENIDRANVALTININIYLDVCNYYETVKKVERKMKHTMCRMLFTNGLSESLSQRKINTGNSVFIINSYALKTRNVSESAINSSL